jgi:hypothetical protein
VVCPQGWEECLQVLILQWWEIKNFKKIAMKMKVALQVVKEMFKLWWISLTTLISSSWDKELSRTLNSTKSLWLCCKPNLPTYMLLSSKIPSYSCN